MTVPVTGDAARVRAVTAPRRRRVRSVGRSLWWFVVPGAAFYLFVVLSPSLQGAYYAFTDWKFGEPAVFNGFDNFANVFQNEAGPGAIRTLLIAGVTVVAQNVLGLGLALLLSAKVLGRNVLRTIIFAPMVVSSLVVGYLFKYIFGPTDIGAIDLVLKSFGLPQIDFLGDPTWALSIIIITIIWQFTGSAMVIYLAGLQGVPEELQEAAALDGAGYWQRFWFVTRPLLAPAFTINLMLGLIGGLKIFDQIFSITAGGPAGETETISTLLYRQFSQYGEYGQAAALALVLAIAVAILSFFQFSFLRRQERKA